MGLVRFLGMYMLHFVREWGVVVVYSLIFWTFRYVVNARGCSFDCWGILSQHIIYLCLFPCVSSRSVVLVC